jgi:hypothetical protein
MDGPGSATLLLQIHFRRLSWDQELSDVSDHKLSPKETGKQKQDIYISSLYSINIYTYIYIQYLTIIQILVVDLWYFARSSPQELDEYTTLFIAGDD